MGEQYPQFFRIGLIKNSTAYLGREIAVYGIQVLDFDGVF